MQSPSYRPSYVLLIGLREASRALSDLDPMGTHHNAALIDDALSVANLNNRDGNAERAALFVTMPEPPNDMGSPEELTAYAEAVLEWRARCGFPSVYDGPIGVAPDAVTEAEAQALHDELTAHAQSHEESPDMLTMNLSDILEDCCITDPAKSGPNGGTLAQVRALLDGGIEADTIRDLIMGDN